MWLVNLTVTKQFVHFLVEGDWGMLCMANFGHFDATCTDCVNWQWFASSKTHPTKQKHTKMQELLIWPILRLSTWGADCQIVHVTNCCNACSSSLQVSIIWGYATLSWQGSPVDVNEPDLRWERLDAEGWTDTSLKVYPSLWHLMTFSWVCHIWAQDVRSWRRFWR